MAEKTDSRLGIQSVEIAAEILKAISREGGLLQLRDISASTGMHRGKVHRYITSLTRSGLLYQDSDTGAYGIGPLAITLGLTGLRRLNPVRLASRELRIFSNLINETVVLTIWGEVGPTVVAIEESNQPIMLNVNVGSALNIRRSAAGQVFEAFMPPDLIKRVIDRENMLTSGAKIKRKPAHDLADVRRRRMARVEGLLLPGINALAAPIFDHNEKLVLVVGVLGRQETLNIDWEGNVAVALNKFANQISGDLGSCHPASPDVTNDTSTIS